ncbi:glycosyltransferase family 4 protein [Aureibaculum luteum]|uniref:glycosyltransferase family 4 protein n=1 Tax=Aureibaculum luteum TaxID=1548456 RepID=UPI000E48A2D8|nr:glycosyltransferase family 4 protein [Aureibaculum luteum]
MKIILVTPLLDHGGGQRYITELANYWSSCNHEVRIILLRSGEPFYSISKNVKIEALGYSSKNRISRCITGIKTFLKLRNAIRQSNPDFVISILSTTNILTLLATSGLGIKIFIRDAMSPFRKRNKFERILRKLLYKKAAGVITMTQIAKDIIQKETGVKNIRIIPNPVRIIKDDHQKKEKIILNVGRLIPAKGQFFLLEACRLINNKDWKFVILGEGNLRKKLEEQINDLNIKGQVLLPGVEKNIDKWLNKSSIFVLPSISEGFPNALLEAMSAGLPVVSFDCKVGPSDIIDDGENGYLVPEGNVHLLAEKIAFLMENATLRNSIAEKAKLDSKKYEIGIISEKILDFCTN